MAKKQPQAAYVAVSKSIQNEWSYLQRIHPDCDSLRTALINNFIPSLIGDPITEIEFQIFEKPTRLAGLGIRDPVINSMQAFNTSFESTKILSKSISTGIAVDIDSYETTLIEVSKQMKKERETHDFNQTIEIIQRLPQDKSNKLKRIAENKCSTWLSIYPTNDNFFAMSPDEFRDALAIRYHIRPKGFPAICDGCGEDFTMNHALNCKKGGLVTARHNEARTLIVTCVLLLAFHKLCQSLYCRNQPMKLLV